jgi:hypothetical protein
LLPIVGSKILWHIDPLLGKDLETDNKPTAVAMQWHGKHTPTTAELLLEMVFSAQSVQRGCLEDQLFERLGGWCEMTTSMGVTSGQEFGTGGCEEKS